MIGSQDLLAFSKASLQLYDQDLRPEGFPQAAFRFLRDLVGAEVVTYALLKVEEGALQVVFSESRPENQVALEGFGRFMSQYPLFCFDPSVNDGAPFFRNDFFTAREFKNLDVYHESFRLLGWTNHAAVHVPTDDGNILFFGLERAGGANFSERDRLVLRLAQEHLSNAHRLARSRQQFQQALNRDPAIFCRAGFSTREAEVLHWLTEGKSNVEIALLMKIQLQTVKGYLTALFNKTGCGNRLALTLYVLNLAQRLGRGDFTVHKVKINPAAPV